MPYVIKKVRNSVDPPLYRVCKGTKRSTKSSKKSTKRSKKSKKSTKRSKCFSKKGLTLEQAKKQRTAIILSEFRRGTYVH